LTSTYLDVNLNATLDLDVDEIRSLREHRDDAFDAVDAGTRSR